MWPVNKIHSDNGTTFQPANKSLPSPLESTGLKTYLRKQGITWQFIPPYAPAQGGAWESMVKQIKRVIFQVLDASKQKPSLIELITNMGNAVRIINKRSLVPFSDNAKDCTVITPASLLTPYASPYSIIGKPRHKDNLKRDYRFNVSLREKFLEKWLEFYLPWLQGRNKWHTVNKNLTPGQLVVLSSPEDIAKRGMYQLGRIHEVIPQIRNAKT